MRFRLVPISFSCRSRPLTQGKRIGLISSVGVALFGVVLVALGIKVMLG